MVDRLDEKLYEIDLNEKRATALRGAFAPFVSSARRAGGTGGSVAARPKMSTRTSAGVGRTRAETGAIREWAPPTVWRCLLAVVSRPLFSRRTRTAETRPPLLPPSPLSEPAAEAEVKPTRRTRKKVAAEG